MSTHDEMPLDYQTRIEQIRAREREMRMMSDDELRSVTGRLKAHLPMATDEASQTSEDRKPIPFRPRLRPSRKKDAPDDR